jgi:hypothetical protein
MQLTKTQVDRLITLGIINLESRFSSEDGIEELKAQLKLYPSTFDRLFPTQFWREANVLADYMSDENWMRYTTVMKEILINFVIKTVKNSLILHFLSNDNTTTQ